MKALLVLPLFTDSITIAVSFSIFEINAVTSRISEQHMHFVADGFTSIYWSFPHPPIKI